MKIVSGPLAASAAVPELEGALAPVSVPEPVLPPIGEVKAVPVTAPGALDASGIPSSFPIGELQSISTASSAGQVFRLDNGFLDALRLQVRRIETAEGQAGYAIQFTIAGPSRIAMDHRITQKGSEAVTFEFPGAKPIEKNGQVVLAEDPAKIPLAHSFGGSYGMPGTKQNPHFGIRLSGAQWTLDYMPHDGPAALRGVMRIRLIGSDEECNQALAQVINHVGLQPAFSPPCAMPIPPSKPKSTSSRS